MNRTRGKYAQLIAKIGVSAVLLTVLLSRVQMGLVLERLRQTSPYLPVAALGLLCLRTAIQGVRWAVVLQGMGHRLSTLMLVRFTYVGIFFNLIFPTAIGGDVVRGYLCFNQSRDKYAATASVVVDRFLGVAALAVYALIAFWLVADARVDAPGMRLALAALLAVSSLTMVAMFRGPARPPQPPPRWRLLLPIARARTLLAGQFARNRKRFVAAFLLGFAIHGCGVVAIFLLSLAIDCDVPLAVFAVYLPLVWVVSMVPVSIGGFGVRETAFVFFFANVGMTKETALAVCFLWAALILAQGIPGAVLFMIGDSEVAKVVT